MAELPKKGVASVYPFNDDGRPHPAFHHARIQWDKVNNRIYFTCIKNHPNRIIAAPRGMPLGGGHDDNGKPVTYAITRVCCVCPRCGTHQWIRFNDYYRRKRRKANGGS